MAETVGNDHIRKYAQESITSTTHFAVDLVFIVVVYASCIYSTFENERFSRSLFTINGALSEQRDALVTERDRVRWVLYHW